MDNIRIGDNWTYAQWQIVDAVMQERLRQERLKAEGRFQYTCADPQLNEYAKLAVLTEEVGEVARVLCERLAHGIRSGGADERLREELVQVAAVCLAWVEGLES
jgi:NTP pyrophosphatase (non-canonical NTP hydrolase)